MIAGQDIKSLAKILRKAFSSLLINIPPKSLVEKKKVVPLNFVFRYSRSEKKEKCFFFLYFTRLIHLQAEPIGNYWKPERSRFEACVAGSLLILAPWKEDLQGESCYERFHNLNILANEICVLGANAVYKIKKTTG